MLSFDSTGGKTTYQVFFDKHKQNDNRYCGKQWGCEQILPFNHIVAVEDRDTNCQRFEYVCWDQCKCNRIFVPCVDKYKDQILPAIIQIPGVSGNTGKGVENVKKFVETAVGSDILFSNNK